MEREARGQRWLDALEAGGIRPVVVQLPSCEEHLGYDGARLLLDHDEPRPTALLCFSDSMAAGAVRAAASASPGRSRVLEGMQPQ